MNSASIDYLASLHEKALAGGEAEQNDLFGALTARFRVLAANRIWDRQDALDVAQDALLTVHRRYRDQQSIPSFTGWAHTILHNKVLEYYRSSSRRSSRFVPMDVEKHGGGSTDDNPDSRRRLRDCLQDLIATNARYGRILVSIYRGHSSDEVCTRLNITKTNFYTTLSRARSMLRHCLEHGRVNH